PLFIIVAESTEILAPIDQLGWATACAGVAAPIVSAEAARNGPPLAVRINLETSAERLPARHWKIALCSLSMGSSVALDERAASVIRAPAVTSASLLARATVLPASTAPITGRKPAQPTIAAMTRSASAAAASTRASSPAAARQFVP